ncbi:TPA: RES family NAD+ phosphorylase [Stenotrophomonas maltophilia]|nr:RES family NAD+ phosphorylase [Stenotrophomonas maltophilia]
MLIELKEKGVCSACVGEPFLAEIIKSNDSLTGSDCDYCGNRLPIVTLEWISKRCRKVFDHFYESTSNDFKVVILEKEPDGENLATCLADLLPTASQILVDDLSSLMLEQIGYEEGDYDDPFYIRRDKIGFYFSSKWAMMSKSLQFEARLCNPLAARILDEVFSPLAQDVTGDGTPVIVLAGPGLPISSLHRARVCGGFDELKKCIAHPEAQLGPVPSGRGSAGRMNAAGVSVFYGATSDTVARAEVRPPVGGMVVIGQFKLIRELRLLDLDALSKINVDPNLSFFNERAVIDIGRRDFLAQLCEQLVVPVVPQDEGSSYVVTQAIADYLATHKELAIDGIIFRSAQIHSQHSSPSGKNVVLFHKASKVVKGDKDVSGSRNAEVIESDDDGGIHVSPRVVIDETKEAFLHLGPFEPDQRKPSLEIDFDSLTLHTIKAVEVIAEQQPVVIARGPLDDFEF